MKKLLSLVMVAAIVLSLGISVFAEENTGSITITNATVDETYTIYKIFDASISVDDEGNTDAVSYSITEDSQFFAVLFGADGKTENTYFVYNENTGSVSKKEGADDAKLVDYLTKLVKDGSYTAAAAPVVATDAEVKFEDLPYGYYLVTSSLGAAVTINSNTPDVEIIDKNQAPGNNFNKQIKIGVDENDQPIWGDSNSANIGDKVEYKVSFEATNYSGDKKILYYQIHDEKGDAIWVEFESFTVSVGGEYLPHGYYLSQGGENTDGWDYLGDWSDIAEAERDENDAQWYLVHLGEDLFRITIPWLEGHTLKTQGSGEDVSYSLTYPENAASKFTSPSMVEITYDAVVEANASIGSTTHGNRFNKAYASWTSANETDYTTPDEVVTYVYGIGLLKDDYATGKNLAGAKFRIYSDETCTTPVFIIPTDVDGVYVVDSLYTAIEGISGANKDTTRAIYAAGLAEYLNGETQDNYAVTPINGKIVILGLKEGTYYIKEVEAPAGYNAIVDPVPLEVGKGTRAFSVFADTEGNVADIQTEDGIHKEIRYDLTSTVVHNSKGVVLPSTGGMGTFWMITIGTLLVMGFAVLLITHKKMSVYND